MTPASTDVKQKTPGGYKTAAARPGTAMTCRQSPAGAGTSRARPAGPGPATRRRITSDPGAGGADDRELPHRPDLGPHASLPAGGHGAAAGRAHGRLAVANAKDELRAKDGELAEKDRVVEGRKA